MFKNKKKMITETSLGKTKISTSLFETTVGKTR